MKLALDKKSEVPLHDQLVEQIMFQIVTGEMVEGAELPSVRALAQRLKIHHNTVSKAYANLVERRWLSRKRGARLHVGALAVRGEAGLDSLIDRTIKLARSMGFSIKELEERVIDRLSFAPPRYVLVVEEEVGLRRILKEEIETEPGVTARTCSPQGLAQHPELAADAYLVGVESVLGQLDPKKLKSRMHAPLAFSAAEEHLEAIRKLKEPSAIGVASYSARLLKAARGVLAAELGDRHSYREFLFPLSGRMDFRAIDLLFCDSLTIKEVESRKKRHYQLVAPEFLSSVTEWFIEPRVVGEQVRRTWKRAVRSASPAD